LTREEEIVQGASKNEDADFNLYFIGAPLMQHYTWDEKVYSSTSMGYARSQLKTPYLSAYSPSGAVLGQTPKEVLMGAAAHELAHNELFEESTGLHHPRAPKKQPIGVKFVDFLPHKNFTLQTEEDDRKRLMWPEYQDPNPVTSRTPSLLLKDECDKLIGVWVEP